MPRANVYAAIKDRHIERLLALLSHQPQQLALRVLVAVKKKRSAYTSRLEG